MKRLLCTLLVLSCMMLSVVASAAPAVALNTNGPDGDSSTVSPQAEQTEWVYRIYVGRLQKRLWSYTQGIWLTDWIDC